MHQRIKELLKQAAKLANTEHNKDFDRSFDMIVAEKFAQLIVRECMEQIHMQSRGPCGDNHGEWYESDILKHFGVEE